MERSFYALEYGHYGAFFHQSKLRGRSESSQTALTPQNVYLAIVPPSIAFSRFNKGLLAMFPCCVLTIYFCFLSKKGLSGFVSVIIQSAKPLGYISVMH